MVTTMEADSKRGISIDDRCCTRRQVSILVSLTVHIASQFATVAKSNAGTICSYWFEPKVCFCMLYVYTSIREQGALRQRRRSLRLSRLKAYFKATGRVLKSQASWQRRDAAALAP